MVKEGKGSRPRWALEESSFITNVCGQKHSGVERTREKKNNQARGSCQGGSSKGESGWACDGGAKAKIGPFLGGSSCRGKTNKQRRSRSSKDHGLWIMGWVSARCRGGHEME